MNSDRTSQLQYPEDRFLTKDGQYQLDRKQTDHYVPAVCAVSDAANILLIISYPENEFIILDKNSLSKIKSIKFKTDRKVDGCDSVIFDSQGQNFFSLSNRGFIQSYNIETGICTNIIKMDNSLQTKKKLLKYSENTLLIFSIEGGRNSNNTILTLDIISKQFEKQWEVISDVYIDKKCLSGDETLLVCPSSSFNTKIYNINTKNIFKNIKIKGLHTVSRAILSPDNSLLICSSTESDLIVIYDVTKMRLYKKINTNGMEDCDFALTSNNKHLVYFEGAHTRNSVDRAYQRKILDDQPKKLCVYDLENNRPVDEFDCKHNIDFIHLDEDTQQIIVASQVGASSFHYKGSISPNMKSLQAGMQFELAATFAPQSFVSVLPKDVRTLIYTNYLFFNIPQNHLRNLMSKANNLVIKRENAKIEGIKKIDFFIKNEQEKVINLKEEAAQLGILRQDGSLPKEDLYIQILNQIAEMVGQLKISVTGTKNVSPSIKDEIIYLDDYIKSTMADTTHLAAYNLALILGAMKISQSNFVNLHQDKLAKRIENLITQATKHSGLSIDKLNTIHSNYLSDKATVIQNANENNMHKNS